MKKLLWLFVAPILITSCKKDSDTSPVPNPEIKTCTLTEVRDSLSNKRTQTFEYDASGRLSKISRYDFSTDSLIEFSTFTYDGNTCLLKSYDSNGTESGTGSLFLNSNGYVTLNRSSRKDINNGGTIPEMRQDSVIITYNQSGQILTYTGHYWSTFPNDSIGKGDVRSTVYEYTNGRLSRINLEVTSDGQPFETEITTYLYNDDSPLVSSNPSFNFFSAPGVTLFGKPFSDKIPASAAISSTWLGQTSNSSKTFSATVDAKGNPVRFRVTSDNGGSAPSNTTLYSYNCP